MSGSVWKVVPDWVWQVQKDTADRRAKALCDIGNAVCDARDTKNYDPTDTAVPESGPPPSRIYPKTETTRSESDRERDVWEWMANHR